MSDLEKMLEKADDLFFHENKLQETYDLLKTLDQSRVEVQYRLARVCFQISKFAKKRAIKAELIKSGFQYAETAIKLDNNNSQAHSWYAVLLDAISEMRGLRERGVRLTDVKRHMLRAKMLDPNDEVPCFIYGMFNYGLADMAWYERLILESLFAKAPEGSYEEALENFLQAEENQPGFYIANKLMIAKCYAALKNYSEAKVYLNIALNTPVKNEDDEECLEEAKQLLSKIKDYS